MLETRRWYRALAAFVCAFLSMAACAVAKSEEAHERGDPSLYSNLLQAPVQRMLPGEVYFQLKQWPGSSVAGANPFQSLSPTIPYLAVRQLALPMLHPESTKYALLFAQWKPRNSKRSMKKWFQLPDKITVTRHAVVTTRFHSTHVRQRLGTILLSSGGRNSAAPRFDDKMEFEQKWEEDLNAVEADSPICVYSYRLRGEAMRAFVEKARLAVENPDDDDGELHLSAMLFHAETKLPAVKQFGIRHIYPVFSESRFASARLEMKVFLGRSWWSAWKRTLVETSPVKFGRVTNQNEIRPHNPGLPDVSSAGSLVDLHDEPLSPPLEVIPEYVLPPENPPEGDSPPPGKQTPVAPKDASNEQAVSPIHVGVASQTHSRSSSNQLDVAAGPPNIELPPQEFSEDLFPSGASPFANSDPPNIPAASFGSERSSKAVSDTTSITSRRSGVSRSLIPSFIQNVRQRISGGSRSTSSSQVDKEDRQDISVLYSSHSFPSVGADRRAENEETPSSVGIPDPTISVDTDASSVYASARSFAIGQYDPVTPEPPAPYAPPHVIPGYISSDGSVPVIPVKYEPGDYNVADETQSIAPEQVGMDNVAVSAPAAIVEPPLLQEMEPVDPNTISPQGFVNTAADPTEVLKKLYANALIQSEGTESEKAQVAGLHAVFLYALLQDLTDIVPELVLLMKKVAKQDMPLGTVLETDPRVQQAFKRVDKNEANRAGVTQFWMVVKLLCLDPQRVHIIEELSSAIPDKSPLLYEPQYLGLVYKYHWHRMIFSRKRGATFPSHEEQCASADIAGAFAILQIRRRYRSLRDITINGAQNMVWDQLCGTGLADAFQFLHHHSCLPTAKKTEQALLENIQQHQETALRQGGVENGVQFFSYTFFEKWLRSGQAEHMDNILDFANARRCMFAGLFRAILESARVNGETVGNFANIALIRVTKLLTMWGLEPVADMVRIGWSERTPIEDGNNFLHLAVLRNDLAALKSLISTGIYLDDDNEKGVTPLKLARTLGRKEAAKILRKANASESCHFLRKRRCPAMESGCTSTAAEENREHGSPLKKRCVEVAAPTSGGEMQQMDSVLDGLEPTESWDTDPMEE